MCFPLHLSKYLALSVLCEWIDVELLCHFDSAICNHVERSAYLDLISAEHVKFQGYFEIAAFKSYLKWIVLRNLRVMNLNIKKKLLSKLQLKSQHCFAELKQLTLDSDILEYKSGFLELIKGCPKLEQLHISGCKVLDDTTVRTIADSCKLLKVVSFPCWDNENLSVTDSSIVYLAERCVLMETFYVANFKRLTAVSITAVSRNCPDLRELTVNNLPLLLNEALLSVAEYSSRLTVLEVRRCPGLLDVGLIAVAERCLELRHLTIDGTPLTETRAQRQRPVRSRVFEDSALIPKLVNLISLRLVEVELSAEMLELITITCKALRVFMLTGLISIQLAGYMCIPKNLSLLTELSLVGCSYLSDQLVVAIAESCPGLTLLDISSSGTSWGAELTEVIIAAIAKHCKRLHSLFLSQKHIRLTENSIRDLLSGCPELRSLDLSYCLPIYSSDQQPAEGPFRYIKGDLSKVITSSTSLRELHVQGLNMDKDIIARLRQIEGLEVFDV